MTAPYLLQQMHIAWYAIAEQILIETGWFFYSAKKTSYTFKKYSAFRRNTRKVDYNEANAFFSFKIMN